MSIEKSEDNMLPSVAPAPRESAMAGAASREVAPLEWREPSSKTNYVWVAKTILGQFYVGNDDGWYAGLEDGTEYWEWEPELDPRAYSGPWAAQKACQEYYEQKIRSALRVSDVQSKTEDAVAAECGACQRGGEAETPYPLLDNAFQAGAEAMREAAAGAVSTFIESLLEGLMTDADITDADRRAMRHQITALEMADEAIRALEGIT